jgi:hypothetical protein
MSLDGKSSTLQAILYMAKRKLENEAGAISSSETAPSSAAFISIDGFI